MEKELRWEDLAKAYPAKSVSEIINEIKDVTANFPASYHMDVFDLMTKNGYKLDMVTGDYYFGGAYG